METHDKKSELDEVLKLLKLELTKKQIREKLGIKPTALANRLRRLENLGCIERKGKYIIKVLRSSHINPEVTKNQVHKKLNKRGHAHNFTILFPKEKNLKEKRNVLNELKKGKLEKLPFGSLKLFKDKNTIWINKNSITVYSNNALHSKFRALKDIDNLVEYLKGRFGFSGIYGIVVFREHYGLIFNKFAKWLFSKGRKMEVKDKGNKAILWADKSRKDDINLEEFEGKNPAKINKADEYFKEHDETNWEHTPKKVNKKIESNVNQIGQNAKHIGKNAQNFKKYADNIESHIGAIQSLGAGVDK